MLVHRWSWMVVALSLTTLGSGCIFPLKQDGSEAADSASRKFWNPFAGPSNGYIDIELATREEDAPPDPKDPISLRLKYALWMEVSQNIGEAQVQYQSILRDEPQNVNALLGLARIDLATGRVTEAERSFQQIIQLSPANHEAFLGYGKCHIQQQRWNEAATTLNHGLQLAPQDKDIRYQLGIALVHTQQIAAAQEHFAASVGVGAAHYNTALILKDMGQLAAAETQLKLALQVNPQLKEAETWLAEIQRLQSGHQTAVQSKAAPIEPGIRQASYQEFEVNGTLSVESGQSIVDEAKGSRVETASGHSVANETVVP